MLKRLYVDNFRCLEDFELNFNSINLFLGDNGAGKSTVFEVLEKLHEFITKEDANLESLFNLSDCTRWQEKKYQIFELEIIGNDGIYQYKLEIEKIELFDIDLDSNAESNDPYFDSIIHREHLWFNKELLLSVSQRSVETYSDSGAKHYSSRYHYSQSILPLLKPDDDNQKIMWFRERLNHSALKVQRFNQD